MTKDPELKMSAGTGNAVAKFGIAVARMKKDDGADFLNCVAFGKTAETIANYLVKGNPILIEGYIKTGSYDAKDGKKVYTTDIIVNRFEFVQAKQQEGSTQKGRSEYQDYHEANDSEDTPF